MSPVEQHDIMNAIELEISSFIQDPSETDLKRYKFYIEQGTNNDMVAPLHDNQFDKFYAYINDRYNSGQGLRHTKESLRRDITTDYECAMRKTIVDYILLSSDERSRVKIEWIPRPFPLK
jgi:dynein heavy chain